MCKYCEYQREYFVAKVQNRGRQKGEPHKVDKTLCRIVDPEKIGKAYIDLETVNLVFPYETEYDGTTYEREFAISILYCPICGRRLEFQKKEDVKKIKLVPKFKVGDMMRTIEEANQGWTEGMPFVVSIDENYYHCNNELIAIADQDKYEYPSHYNCE